MILTLTDQLDIIARECIDDSDDTRKDAKMKLNIYQDEILSSKEYKFTEGFYSFTSVAEQPNYDFSVNHKKVKTITPTVDSMQYAPLTEIIDPNEWDFINSGTTISTNYPTHFHIRNKQLYVYPTPIDANVTFSVVYTKRAKPMKYEDYNTNSITVTNGSKSVTGTNTEWSGKAERGTKIRIENDWYEIETVSSNTALILTQKYQGTSNSGITDYKIGDTSLIHEDFQGILWNRYCYEYFRRNNPERAADYFGEMSRLKADMDSYVVSQTTSRVIDLDKRHIIDPYKHPRNLVFNA